jgi:diguanylate cyclase (GGDEF)-like protein
MGTLVSGPHLIILVLLLFTAALILIMTVRQRKAGELKSSLAAWSSKLQIVSEELADSNDLAQMAESALTGTLATFSAKDGYVLLRGEAAGGSIYTSARGFSQDTVALLAAGPMRAYLGSSVERWGTSLVLSDLGKSGVTGGGRRDRLLHKFTGIMRDEGFKSLLVIGLGTEEKTYGVLLVGRRNSRTFAPQELQRGLVIGSQTSMALDTWLLNQAAKKRNEETKVLYNVGRALRETFDLKAQVEILRRETKGLLEDTDFSLALQNSPEGPLETVVPFEQENGFGSATVALASSPEGYVMRTRSPLLISEDFQWTARGIHLSPLNPKFRTWCGVPIRFCDGSMGVLSAANFQHQHAITPEQFELIQVLANEAAGGFENARIFQREQRRASHLALLNEIGRKATSVLDPKELLPNICGQVQSAFGYDLARVEIMDRVSGELVVEAEAGYGSELLGRRVRLGEGLSGFAAESGEPVLANSVAEEPRYIALDPQVRSGLSLPLRYLDATLGVLSLESRREYAFNPQDVLVLKTLADQLAIALHNARAYQFVKEESITDGLTGVKTHRYFMETLEREWRRCARSGQPFCVIMIDLDQFKPVNDRHGHLEGDRVLSTVAKALNQEVRQSSVVARYGGDEFSVLVPDATTQEAKVLSERLRLNIVNNPFLASHRVTASFGIGSFPEHGATHEEILHVADAGMFLAKHEGGNRVRVASLTSAFGQVEACLGVEFKRKFSTGPEAFARILTRIEKVIQHPEGEILLVDAVTSLARAIDLADHYTRNHGQAVSQLAMLIARQLGMPEEEVEEICRAGILHDIGKIGIPDKILQKPDRLTAEEFEVMKSHSAKGEMILKPLNVGVIQRICRSVRHHHEWFDGRGYPDHLKGEEIPLGARILTVADAFNAMVSARGYKKARTHKDALAELECCRGTQFDPNLVEAFARALEIHGPPLTSESQEAQEGEIAALEGVE